MQKGQKQLLRQKMLTLIKGQSEEDRTLKSNIIFEKLVKLPEFEKSTTILFYFSFSGEVETFEMIKRAQQLGKKVGLPRVIKSNKSLIPLLIKNLSKDLEQGPYGIPQPKADNEEMSASSGIDMVIVPGIAFDNNNNRLGRGAGYYDRFLSILPKSVYTVGLGFDFQVLDSLPEPEEHDMRLSHVICN